MKRMRFRKLHRKKHATPPGASPGTLVVPSGATKPRIRIMAYNAEDLEERWIDKPGELKKYINHPTHVTWIEVRGVGDEALLRSIAELFNIHPLALEDVVNQPQRPKTEDYDQHMFVIMRMVMLRSATDMEAQQVSMFLGKNYVLTFLEDSPDCFDPVRDRLRKKGVHRRSGADYLCYSLVDAIIDHYFPVLESYGEYLESLEETTVAHPTPATLQHIHIAKRELIDLRRVLWPQREAINQLVRSECPLISKEVTVFLRDCYDHSIQVMDMVENYREITSGLHDVYLSSIGNRTNEIMKVLTIISTIFIPLTFIAGVYGMNFDPDYSPYNMPELRARYGYPAAMLVMTLIAIALIFYFWHKGWIFSNHNRMPVHDEHTGSNH
jgi:magnesium transporter